VASTSAQAQIEVVVRNINSLTKLDKTLNKLNRTNEELIRGVDNLTKSIDKLAKVQGFNDIAQDAKNAGKEIDDVGKKLRGIDAALARDKAGKQWLRGRVEKDFFFRIERAVARTHLAGKARAESDVKAVWEAFEKGKASALEFFTVLGSLPARLKIVAQNAREIQEAIAFPGRSVKGKGFEFEVPRQSLAALQDTLNSVRNTNKELPIDNKHYRDSVRDVLFAEKQVNKELLDRKRILEGLTTKQRAFREKINRTIIEARERRASGAFTGGFAEFNKRADRIKAEADAKRANTIEFQILQTRKIARKAALRAGALRELQRTKGLDIEERINRVLEKRIGIHNKLGFGKNANAQGMFASRGGMGGRVRGGVSSAMIGGAFPFLFGQGGASAAGGALGGAAGGMLGGGLGFGLSLIGTAIGSAIEKFDKLNEKIAVANGRMKAMGFESEFTRQEIEKMAKSLKITKDEAIQVASTFARFGKERALTLGGFFGADTAGFDAVAKVRDQASALAAIQTLSKDISFEKQKELIALVRTNTAAQIQIKLQTVLLEVQQLKKIELIKEIGLRERILNITRRTWNVISQFTTPGLMIAGETPGQRVERQLKEAEEQFAKMKALIDGAMAEIGSVDTNINLISNFDKLPEVIRQTEAELIKLKDPMFQVIEASKAISGAFKESFKGIISGTMSVQEAFARMFQRIADHFLDMAAQMAATQLQRGILSLFSNFGSPSVGTQVGNMIGTFGEGGHVANGIKSFSTGGLVTRPTIGLVGEAGEDEYIIPSSKMQGAMERYSAGARGQGVIPGSGTVASGSGVSSTPTVVNYTGPVLSFDSEAYVPKSAIPEIINSAARRGAQEGESKVFSKLKNSRSQRSRVGM
jgi:hypothetical protein